MFNNQKGFSLIFIFLPVIIILAIIGGAFYIKSSRVSLDKVDTKNSVPIASTVVSELSKKVLFQVNEKDTGKKLYFSDPDGKNRRPFKEHTDPNQIDVNFIPSGDCSTILATSMAKNDLEKLNSLMSNFQYPKDSGDYEEALKQLEVETEELSANIKESNILYSSEGRLLKTIDIEKIRNQLGEYKFAGIVGWSSDNKKLLLSLYNSSASDKDLKDQAIGIYDIDSETSEIIFSKKANRLYINFYDPMRKYLVYNTEAGGNEPSYVSKSFIRDLNSNTEKDFRQLNRWNRYNTAISILGKYFVDAPQNISLRDDVSLQIYSIYEPDKTKVNINLTAPERYYFDRDIIWSADLSKFAVLLEYERSGTGIPRLGRKLNIYNRDSTQAMSADLNDLTENENGYAEDDFSAGAFSKDGNYFLYAAAKLFTGQNVDSWRVFDARTGKLVINKFYSDNLGQPLCWQ